MIQMAFLSISHLAYRAQKIHRTANIIVSDNWGSGVSVAAQIEKKNELFGKKSWLSMKVFMHRFIHS